MRKVGPESGLGADAGGASPLSAVVRVRSLLPSLPPAEARVAQRVIDDPEAVANSTITELAQACGTSETTVIRFCRAIGFSGYPELRLTLATEAGRAQGVTGGRVVGSDISADDTLEQVVEKIAFADARAVEETANQLDIEALDQVVTAIVAARRVDIYGVGVLLISILLYLFRRIVQDGERPHWREETPLVPDAAEAALLREEMTPAS